MKIPLSAFTDESMVQQIMRAGASGYLTKQTAFTELVQAIRAVTAGKMYLSPDLIRATSFAGAASGERF